MQKAKPHMRAPKKRAKEKATPVPRRKHEEQNQTLVLVYITEPPQAHHTLILPAAHQNLKPQHQVYLHRKAGVSERGEKEMEVLVSTAASARAAAPLSFAPFHRRPPPSVAARVPTRGWRCRCAGPVGSDPVPSEDPASASTVVVTEKPAAEAGEEASGEVGAVSGGSGGAVEATVVAAQVPSEAPGEDGGADDILSKLDIEVTPAYVLFGTGAFVALLILSSVISAIDSVPLLPNVLELVGTGYSIWFTARYLLFKENRDQLFAKFEDLKDRII